MNAYTIDLVDGNRLMLDANSEAEARKFAEGESGSKVKSVSCDERNEEEPTPAP